MKKIIFLVIIYIIILFYAQKNITLEASLNNKVNNYNGYYVYIDKTNLTTRNIEDYFNILNITLIYPNNKHITDEVLLNQLESFKLLNSEVLYIQVLNKYLLTDNVDKINRNGLLVDKVLLRISNKELKRLKKNNPNLKYSSSLNGLYI